MNIPLFYILIINLISIIVTIHDKRCAVKNKWRTKESTLLLLAAVGGSVGMYITMQVIRHKTKHIKFMLGLPVIIVCQCVLAWLIWRTVNGQNNFF